MITLISRLVTILCFVLVGVLFMGIAYKTMPPTYVPPEKPPFNVGDCVAHILNPSEKGIVTWVGRTESILVRFVTTETTNRYIEQELRSVDCEEKKSLQDT